MSKMQLPPKSSYSLQEVAAQFAVNLVTMKKWLEPYLAEIGIPKERNKFGELNTRMNR